MLRSLTALLCAAALATGVGGSLVPTGYGGFNVGESGPTCDITQPAPQGTPVGNYVAFSSLRSFSYFRSDRTEFCLDGVDFFSRRGLDAVGGVSFVLCLAGLVMVGTVARRRQHAARN